MSNEGAVGRRGQLFIVSAPSGTGKTTLVARLVRQVDGLRMSRSYTSRPARDGEADGRDYNFVTRERFQAMIEADGFLEYAEIFGNLYGTGAEDTRQALSQGCDLVLVIDVQGARKVRAKGGLRSVGIFVLPPSFATLEARLRGRSKDTEEQIRRRLRVARDEVHAFSEYDYLVVNDDIDACVERMRAIVIAERARLAQQHPVAETIVGTFENGEPK